MNTHEIAVMILNMLQDTTISMTEVTAKWNEAIQSSVMKR